MKSYEDVIQDFHQERDPDVMRANAIAAGREMSHAGIPDGDYCYKALGLQYGDDGAPSMKIAACPYWASVHAMPEQMNGYCALTSEGDWQDGSGLLWDRVKQCGVNCASHEMLDERATEAALLDDYRNRSALHRGFNEQCQWSGSTDITAQEMPLPNLTWSRQPIESIKHWLGQGGFDWEVTAALKRKAKGQAEDAG